MSENKELLEEAIKHFKSLQKRYTTEHNGKMCEKVALALEAMEKQVPKKVTHEATLYRCHTCPSCKNVIDEFVEFMGKRTLVQVSNCKYCGQALLWEDIE